MVQRICPHCGEVYSVNEHAIDYVHKCNSGDSSLDYDSVPVVGDYVDEATGSTVHVPNAMNQGANPTNFGTKSHIEGERDYEVDAHENRSNTHRQRQHYEYINFEDKDDENQPEI